MFLVLIKAYWKQILLVILISILGFLIYTHIYNSGYSAASVVYEARIKDYNDKLDKRITNIEANSTVLVTASEQHQATLSLELDAIAVLAKKKPLYVINQGKCTPSQDFLDSYNSLIIRGNQK